MHLGHITYAIEEQKMGQIGRIDAKFIPSQYFVIAKRIGQIACKGPR